MGFFIKKLLKFLLVFGLLLATLSISYKKLQEYYLQEGHFKVEKSTQTLLMGDSHIQTSLDDKVINNSKNIAKAGEHFLCSYAKLRHLLGANSQIQNLVIGVGAHNFSENSDNYFFSDEQNSGTFSDYFFLMNQEEVSTIKSTSHNWRINFLKYKLGIPFQTKLEIPFLWKRIKRGKNRLDDFNFVGGYNPKKGNGFTHMMLKNALSRHFYQDGKVAGISTLNGEYLTKIIELARAKNIQVLLLNTPVSKAYSSKIPKIHQEYFEEFMNNLLLKNPELKYLDLSRMEWSDEMFCDAHHLNVAGSEELSSRINSYLIGP